jgi:hypothetical protein
MQQLSDSDILSFRRLVDEAACRSLIERYTYAVDWMNWSGLEALFWSDALFDFGMWQGGRAEFIPWVTKLEESYRRRLHMFAAPRIEVTGELARVEAGAVMFMRQSADRDDLILARYQFQAAKRKGDWRLSRLHFFLHGSQSFPASDQGGASFFADGLDTSHALFAQ